MTKEEIAHGRDLLQAYLDRATYANEGALASWFALKAEELLSLAEEARHRRADHVPSDVAESARKLAFERGLRRGLELAKEHARVKSDDPFFGCDPDIYWGAADAAVDKECE